MWLLLLCSMSFFEGGFAIGGMGGMMLVMLVLYVHGTDVRMAANSVMDAKNSRCAHYTDCAKF